MTPSPGGRGRTELTLALSRTDKLSEGRGQRSEVRQITRQYAKEERTTERTCRKTGLTQFGVR